jgi:ElaB/YqjD/DUF883 family membrane-anchored ribosome-binding protein
MDETKKTPGDNASDTLSAAKISAGTSVGTPGQPPNPPQSATLASHTAKPLGGTTTSTGASNLGQSGGPEHNRHQDRTATQAGGAKAAGGQSGGSSGGQSDELLREAQERAGETYEQATQWARESYEQAADWASETFSRARSRSGSMGGGGVQRFIADNPVMVGVVGFATGLLLGSLLPRTRQEDRTIGRWSDEVREQGLRYAQEMAQRGREFVDETFSGDEDPRFAHHENEFRPGDSPAGTPRSGPGRYQNH